MINHKALLEAIIATPDDDAPRLAYTDWHSKNGRLDQAEFIRLQCELAHLADDAPGRAEKESRAEALRKENERTWITPLRSWIVAWEFHRGFVETITIRPEVFLDNVEALFQLAPIRHVRFETGMLRLERPNLVFSSAAALMPKLATCSQLARLASIDLSRNLIADAGVQALAASPFLASLISLDLNANDIGDAGVEALAESPNFSRLRMLNLNSNRIGSAGARSLAASRHIASLTVLDLGNNAVGEDGIEAIAASPNFARVVSLNLARTRMKSAGARALAASAYLGEVKSIDVSDNVIGNGARKALRLRFGKGRCRF